MKVLLTLLIVFAGMQPPALQACDADMDTMPHHETMSDSSDHDCCDEAPQDSSDGCDESMQCDACVIVISLLESNPAAIASLPDNAVAPMGQEQATSVQDHPPFRPPIS